MSSSEQQQLERVQQMIGALPDEEPPPQLSHRVFAQLAESPSPRRRKLAWWMFAPPAIAAIAAVALMRCSSPAESQPLALRVTVQHDQTVRRATSAAIGDALIIESSANASEIRIYRNDGQIVATCPGSTNCVVVDDKRTLRIVTEAPGTYRAVVLSVALGRLSQGFEADLGAAREHGAQITVGEPIEIR